MTLPGPVYSALEKIVGKDQITEEKEELQCYSYDASGISYLPDCVIFPESEAQISDILKTASRNKIVVIPRGAGSGMTGGAIPVHGGIVLNLTRMNRIIEVDRNNFFAKVQPGVVVQTLHEHVESSGLFYPPDPASSAVCTIGGNIAECAGGPRAVKYGVTRDYVIGLRAVLPSGEVIATGVKTAKGVAGYDLTRLIVGSEGTLAVVTEVTLRLIAKPSAVKTMAAFFPGMDLAAKAVSAIMRKSVVPRCVEYLDQSCLKLVKDHIRFPVTEEMKALLIIELDGDPLVIESDSEKLRSVCREYKACQILEAQTKEETQKLWDARKALSPILYKIATSKINEDIVVPIDKISDMVVCTQQIEKEFGLTVVSFGHAGDGNIHCNIMYEKSDPDQNSRAHKAVQKLFDETLKMGGTITGEHGVGITKIDFLPKEIGPVQIELMRGIKKVFDPDNILNPGKIF